MTYKKKLIEVAIPLEAINAASAREKSIRHGHPSTLHLWWARRPLAACRAVLFAQLVDDDGHAHGAPRQAGLGENTALEELEILAVATTVIGKIPGIDDTPMIRVGDGLDGRVDALIHRNDGLPDLRREFDDFGLRQIDGAFGRMGLAEPGPAQERSCRTQACDRVAG